MRPRTLVPLIALCTFVPSSANSEQWSNSEQGSEPGDESYSTLTPAQTRITVRIYEVDAMGSELKSVALDTAAKTLSAAAITVGWRDCPRAPLDDAPGACQTPALGEFVLRIVRSTLHHEDDGLPLGDTFVDKGTRSAVLATVYVDRVNRVAAATDTDPAALLGYAIAHEIGHLLMASTDHSRSGLMRPVWRAAELRARRSADWKFTAADIASIANRLSASRSQ